MRIREGPAVTIPRPRREERAVEEMGRGAKVFDHAPVRGTWRRLEGPDDVLDLMDTGAEGIVAAISDAGATFLAPLYHELTAVVCTGGTPRSHVGIVSREFQVPCVMGSVFAGGEPPDGAEVEVDCSGDEGIVRA
jgi:phosphoenolpyruvate-protein kinase (PTS system EI component)